MAYNLIEKAQTHLKYIKEKYLKEIEEQIRNSKIYTERNTGLILTSPCANNFKVVEADSVRALHSYGRESNTCVLNFASYKNPGGGFLKGMNTQEEALCHESTLYPVLESFLNTYYTTNRKNSNKALYGNKAIYSKDIIFGDRKADVLTCAAPNWTAAKQFYKVTREDNEYALESRIEFMARILAKENVNTLIAGAWGCGVFGQNPRTVAEGFKKYFAFIPEVIYAIPDGDSINFRAFKEVFGV